jgi:hypothetical protein
MGCTRGARTHGSSFGLGVVERGGVCRPRVNPEPAAVRVCRRPPPSPARCVASARRVTAKIDAGILWVNCWLHRDLRTAFGGMKDSGVGREGGKFSLEFYSEYKNVCVFLGRP